MEAGESVLAGFFNCSSKERIRDMSRPPLLFDLAPKSRYFATVLQSTFSELGRGDALRCS